jgi:pyridoxamine 5'-phosphate oxidase
MPDAAKNEPVTSSREMTFDDPLAQFDLWLREAEASEPNDPNAAALATATASGAPSVRMVLAKRAGEERFCFFTNAESEKGRQLAENPRAALCFHWKSLRRQVRVEGSVTGLSEEASDDYFHSRSRGSQIGAAVSDQSRALLSRDVLEAKAHAFAEAHPGEIPRPAYWRGFCLHPEHIEFWLNGPDRLHDRFLFTRDGERWQRSRLYP